MNVNEWIKSSIRSDFIGILKNKDILKLNELKNNNILLYNLLYSIGAIQETMSKPVYREQLEVLLGEIIGAISEVFENSRNELGYEVKFNEDGALKVRIEGFSSQDDYELKIDENGYSFNEHKLRTNIGIRERYVQAVFNKNQISYLKQIEGMKESSTEGIRFTVDDHGFVTKKKCIKEQGEQKIEKTTYREGNKVITSQKTTINWDGDPLNLNVKDVTQQETLKKARHIISKYPATKKYYEEILGIKFKEISLEGE